MIATSHRQGFDDTPDPCEALDYRSDETRKRHQEDNEQSQMDKKRRYFGGTEGALGITSAVAGNASLPSLFQWSPLDVDVYSTTYETLVSALNKGFFAQIGGERRRRSPFDEVQAPRSENEPSPDGKESPPANNDTDIVCKEELLKKKDELSCEMEQFFIRMYEPNGQNKVKSPEEKKAIPAVEKTTQTYQEKKVRTPAEKKFFPPRENKLETPEEKKLDEKKDKLPGEQYPNWLTDPEMVLRACENLTPQ